MWLETQALSMGREVRIGSTTAAPKGRAGDSEWTARKKKIAVVLFRAEIEVLTTEDFNMCQRD